MKIEETLFQLRKEKGLSQEELAEKLNVSRQTISKWETGETLPDIENLKNLALILEFSIDNMLDIEVSKAEGFDDWLWVGGFIVGTGLAFAFDNFLLPLACSMIGFGFSFILESIKKNKRK